VLPSSKRLSATLPCAAIIALISGCDTNGPQSTAPNSVEPTTIGAARILGAVRDSLGNPIDSAKIHVYRGGNDSVPDTTILSQTGGKFQIDLAPGKIKLFAEKDGRQAQALELSDLKLNQIARIDTLKLCKILNGSFNIPGIQGASFSVRIEGSPLVATVSTDGAVGVKVVDGQESILILTYTSKSGASQVYKFRISATHGKLSIEPISNQVRDTVQPPPFPRPVSEIVIRPGNEAAQAGVIGSLAGNSTRWANTNFGSRLEEGIGGAWDGNTVGRLLWKVNLPDSLAHRQVLSARLVFTTLSWGIRPTGGQDLTVEGYRLLKAWKEGHGPGQEGLAVSADNDGASASGPSYGKTWNAPLVGLDGVDAESHAVTRATLPYKSLEKFSIDITPAVNGWLSNPSSNNGLVFRSIHEADGLYLDYPAFASDDYADSSKRPYLVLELAPANVDPAIKLLSLQPGPEGQDDACVIGTFTGTGSHDGNTQGTDPHQSLGGSWDYNTVGRLLWKIQLPDSLKTKTIVSATATFKVNQWLTRPLGGHDYKVEAFKMLRSWKEGLGAFPGEPNSSALDGASSLGPSYGTRWNAPLVGLDGVDAEQTRSAYGTLPWNDTTSISFDFTALAKFWLANPEKNNGVLLRSLEELDPSFPNFPGFRMSEDANPSLRPKLVIQYK
jgi:hypothetical protein